MNTFPGPARQRKLQRVLSDNKFTVRATEEGNLQQTVSSLNIWLFYLNCWMWEMSLSLLFLKSINLVNENGKQHNDKLFCLLFKSLTCRWFITPAAHLQFYTELSCHYGCVSSGSMTATLVLTGKNKPWLWREREREGPPQRNEVTSYEHQRHVLHQRCVKTHCTTSYVC